jgi:hypothetical protein
VASNHSLSRDGGTAGKAETLSEMLLFRRSGRQRLFTAFDFEDTLLALALFHTRCRNADTDGLRTVEEGYSRSRIDLLMVDKELAH